MRKCASVLAIYSLLLFNPTSTPAQAEDQLEEFNQSSEKRPVSMACAMFPPYKIESKNKKQPHSGIDLEVIQAAFSVAGREVDFNFYPWKRTVKMAERGQTDALCGCAYRPERGKSFIYSDMLGLHSQGIFINEESDFHTVEQLDDLRGRSIAAVRGYAVHKELQDKKDIRAVEANDDTQLLRLLLANRVDAIYSYRDIILYRMAMNSETRHIRYYELNSQPYYLCFSRNRPDIEDIVQDFNKGLRTIRFNGTYNRIWESYR
ncbi:substrate-binding periplasmic protein [Oceanospirillum sediminis]|uniref:Transporter substrate-binding domain-containing protein n=1 Tax=Oceanospirillum sediminis TaxID=2760088 RepID=A0A839ISR8_9GAMM|nr:transporter substrate-binding domain-containing protein [Oceanospirillum sediminis]MBB1487519.1 transporter substrate-binding domain-containing protein [Oceanospirillum sediminis]